MRSLFIHEDLLQNAKNISLDHPDWNIQQIASKLGVSTSTLYRCKFSTGKKRCYKKADPSLYDKACELLTDHPDWNIEQIASELRVSKSTLYRCKFSITKQKKSNLESNRNKNFLEYVKLLYQGNCMKFFE